MKTQSEISERLKQVKDDLISLTEKYNNGTINGAERIVVGDLLCELALEREILEWILEDNQT